MEATGAPCAPQRRRNGCFVTLSPASMSVRRCSAIRAPIACYGSSFPTNTRKKTSRAITSHSIPTTKRSQPWRTGATAKQPKKRCSYGSTPPSCAWKRNSQNVSPLPPGNARQSNQVRRAPDFRDGKFVQSKRALALNHRQSVPRCQVVCACRVAGENAVAQGREALAAPAGNLVVGGFHSRAGDCHPALRSTSAGPRAWFTELHGIAIRGGELGVTRTDQARYGERS